MDNWKVPASEVCKHDYLVGHCNQCTIDTLRAEVDRLRKESDTWEKHSLVNIVNRSEKYESQNKIMREALLCISKLDYSRAAVNACAFDAVKLSVQALKEVE